MKKINIIIPLAGIDKRFEENNIFKAFVEVKGKPLVKFCTDSLPYPFQRKNIQIYFIILREHEEKYSVSKKLKKLYPKSKIIIISKTTEGAACTALMAKEYINNSMELIIYLADIYFEGDIENSIYSNPPVVGFIPTFKSKNIKYSYAKINLDREILRVAEKVIISDNASAGFYYFKHGKDFVEAAEVMVKDDLKRAGLGENKWFFICPVYNELIKAKKICKVIPVKFNLDFGDNAFIKKILHQNDTH